MQLFQIALDGPAGSGKSTTAKLLAQELSCVYLDTGALYRAVTLMALQENLSPGELSQVLSLSPPEIGFRFLENVQRTYLNGRDVSETIRSREVSQSVSASAANKDVRDFLLDHQRKIALTQSVVMDGRDIGTVVLPQATLKIFLVAEPGIRARRRLRELRLRGEHVSFSEMLYDIQRRDVLDSSRSEAPLRCPDDAIVLDSTSLTIPQQVDVIKNLLRARLEQT